MQLVPSFAAGVNSNDVLWYPRGNVEANSFCSDLVDAVLGRIDYFFEEKLETTGCYVAVQLLLCLMRICKEGCYADLIEELKARMQRHRHQLDKKTALLFSYASQ